jgi:alkanesulfonate monooxygenase SsuD/methylene tetrahydromethanopterin reductase-like flavin-dependent oxidoreductase (luciferase family)
MQERGSVKYYISTAFLRTRDVLELATVADELGYHGLAIGDHVSEHRTDFVAVSVHR